MVSLGFMLDKSYQQAYTDSITGLPNMRAAMDECESMVQQHLSTQGAFTVLLIDGDDLSKYNKIGYLAGDEMINQLGAILKIELRPGDFLARWRTGDEFLILLGGTSTNLAVSIANRLCKSVSDASQSWTYPITISIGVAGFPEHGKSMTDILHQAELALTQAKNLGKNQVFVKQ